MTNDEINKEAAKRANARIAEMKRRRYGPYAPWYDSGPVKAAGVVGIAGLFAYGMARILSAKRPVPQPSTHTEPAAK
jgi:hypothetical protein